MRTSPFAACLAAATFLVVLTAPAAAQEPMLPGSYRFTERVAGNPPIILEGDIEFTGDSIWVKALWASCLWSSSTTTSVLRYECGRVVLSFDRIDLMRRANYSTHVTILERVEVCEEYTVNASGQRVCARIKRDMVEREVTKTARINPKRSDG
jgi:hypothetical protein